MSATSTGTTLVFELPEQYEGEHTVFISASAEGFRSGESESVTIEFVSAGLFLTTNSGELIITNSGDNIEINEGE